MLSRFTELCREICFYREYKYSHRHAPENKIAEILYYIISLCQNMTNNAIYFSIKCRFNQ